MQPVARPTLRTKLPFDFTYVPMLLDFSFDHRLGSAHRRYIADLLADKASSPGLQSSGLQPFQINNALSPMLLFSNFGCDYAQ